MLLRTAVEENKLPNGLSTVLSLTLVPAGKFLGGASVGWAVKTAQGSCPGQIAPFET